MRNKAQSILEYVVLLAIVAAALATMQIYIKRGIQAGVKIAADEIGSQDYAQQIDPQKGVRTSSRIRKLTSGAAAGTADLPQGTTRRIRVSPGGEQRLDIDENTAIVGKTEYISVEQK